MRLTPDGTLLAQGALSMSRLSADELSAQDAEMARLVRLTLAGDSTAFEQIVRRYESRVMTMAARILGGRDDARDAAQEVFLRAFKYLHRVDLQKPVGPWLMAITVNVCRDAARTRQQRRDTFIEVEAPETIDISPDPFAGAVRQQERLLLRRALDELPEKERLAILLRDVEGFSSNEVARILQSTETTVRSQVSRGRLKLKAVIDRLTGGRR